MRRMGSRGNESRRKQVATFSNETIVVHEYIGVFVDRVCQETSLLKTEVSGESRLE